MLYTMKVINEFKEFAVRGNVIDLAVGLIIGASFSSIVSSLVDDVIMPPVGLLTGGVDLSSRELVLQTASETTGKVAINYGNFIGTILEFLLVALAVFIIVKYINSLQRERSTDEESPAGRRCEYCKEVIASDASRCPHCTAKLPN